MEQEILYNILTGRYGEILETHAMWECISALGIKPFKDGNQWCFSMGIIFKTASVVLEKLSSRLLGISILISKPKKQELSIRVS